MIIPRGSPSRSLSAELDDRFQKLERRQRGKAAEMGEEVKALGELEEKMMGKG